MPKMNIKMLKLQIQYFFANAIYAMGNTVLRLIGFILFRDKTDRDFKNILIFRTGNLGDTFCAIPAMKLVKERFPDARFIFMTSEGLPNLPHPVDVLNGLLEFDEIYLYKPTALKNLKYLFKVVGQIRRKNVDLIVYLSQYDASLPRFIRDILFFRMTGCKSICGFQWTKHRLFAAAQYRYRKFDREVYRHVKLLSPLGVSDKISWDIPEVLLNINPSSFTTSNSRTVIAIHPGAKFPVNHWPVERFLEVAFALKKAYNPFFIVVGGSDIKESAGIIAQSMKNDILDLSGKTSFLDLAGILRQCDLLISNDSGPVHVAAAVGTPVVGIYTARDFPECWYPWGKQHIILRKDISCQICLKTECQTMDCIKSILPEEVIAACDQILKNNHKAKISSHDK